MILIGLGSNLHSQYGTPQQTIDHALACLRGSGMLVKNVSSLCLSAPVPFSPNQTWFWNAVAKIKTQLPPRELMATLLRVEERFGRERSVPNASRTLDLDLLDYNGLVLKEEGLELPHPRMAQRGFVLYPLREIAPDWIDPVSGKNIVELIAALPEGQCVVSVVRHETQETTFRPCRFDATKAPKI